MTAYMADVFEHLNVLNVSLLGNYIDVFRAEDKIEAYTKSLIFGYTC